MYKVPVDHNLMESNVYRDPSFPLEFYYDDYGALIDHTLNYHWHPDIEMEVVLQGAVDFYLNGVLVPLSAGQCIFVNSGTLHMAHQREEGGRALVFGFTFRPELFSKEYPNSGFHKYFSEPSAGFAWDDSTAQGREVLAAIHEMRAMERESFQYEIRCLSLLCQIWLRTAERMKQENSGNPVKSMGYDGQVKRLLSYIHEHYREKVTLEQLSSFTNISRSECFRRFRQYTGTTPILYLNDYRLSKAAALLRSSDQSVTEICYSCGFSDASYFVRRFREKFDLPPRKYRNHFQDPRV